MKFTVIGRLDGLNEYTKACRSNYYAANDMKQFNQLIVREGIKEFKQFEKPVGIHIKWFEKNAKRDIDNITFAVKFILDELVNCRILINDSQKYVKKITHEVSIDRKHPRIEIEVKEID